MKTRAVAPWNNGPCWRWDFNVLSLTGVPLADDTCLTIVASGEFKIIDKVINVKNFDLVRCDEIFWNWKIDIDLAPETKCFISKPLPMLNFSVLLMQADLTGPSYSVCWYSTFATWLVPWDYLNRSTVGSPFFSHVAVMCNVYLRAFHPWKRWKHSLNFYGWLHSSSVSLIRKGCGAIIIFLFSSKLIIIAAFLKMFIFRVELISH